MFDIGFWELIFLFGLGLVILGPERLPKLARTLGFWVGKARRMVADVKSDIDREMRESELADLRKLGDEITDVKDEIEKAGNTAAADSSLASVTDSIRQSANDLQSTVKDAVEVDEVKVPDSTKDGMEDSPAGTDPSTGPDKRAAT